MDEYLEKIIIQLEDNQLWPQINSADFLDVLEAAADSAFEKHTIEGYLASFLIYQQISEEMAKNIIKLGRFVNQVLVFPYRIEYKNLESGRPPTFGALLSEMASIPNDETAEELLRELSTLQDTRNTLVHKITKKKNLEEIEEESSQVRELFLSIQELYFEVEEGYRLILKDYRKDYAGEWREEYIT